MQKRKRLIEELIAVETLVALNIQHGLPARARQAARGIARLQGVRKELMDLFQIQYADPDFFLRYYPSEDPTTILAEIRDPKSRRRRVAAMVARSLAIMADLLVFAARVTAWAGSDRVRGGGRSACGCGHFLMSVQVMRSFVAAMLLGPSKLWSTCSMPTARSPLPPT